MIVKTFLMNCLLDYGVKIRNNNSQRALFIFKLTASKCLSLYFCTVLSKVSIIIISFKIRVTIQVVKLSISCIK